MKDVFCIYHVKRCRMVQDDAARRQKGRMPLPDDVPLQSHDKETRFKQLKIKRVWQMH